MEKTIAEVISDLESEAAFFSEVNYADTDGSQKTMTIAAAALVDFRDVLMQMALGESHQPEMPAHDVLRKYGLCSHNGQIHYVQEGSSRWRCMECNAMSGCPDKLVAFRMRRKTKTELSICIRALSVEYHRLSAILCDNADEPKLVNALTARNEIHCRHAYVLVDLAIEELNEVLGRKRHD